jgi:peptidoglycan/xylan/chitin deacetylase (PgdA/CDA1 family)
VIGARAALRVLAPAGPKSRLSVMIFHRVLAGPDPLFPEEPDAVAFEARMRWVKDWFNVLPLDEAVRCLREGRLPERPLAITFDDGYADNARIAAPILRRLGIPATFFIATGFLDGGRMWNDTVIEALRMAKSPELDFSPLGLGVYPIGGSRDRRAAIDRLIVALKHLRPRERAEKANRVAELAGATPPGDLMMSAKDVHQLHADGMTIGAHTVNHPILARIDDGEARAEIESSRRRLEEITAAPVRLFAYPNGKPAEDYGLRHVEMVRTLGFDGAVTTGWGVAQFGADHFQLPRFTPWDRQRWRYGLRLLRNLLEPARTAIQ